jgi:hypothetical protein
MSATYNAVYTKPGATFADVLEAKANKNSLFPAELTQACEDCYATMLANGVLLEPVSLMWNQTTHTLTVVKRVSSIAAYQAAVTFDGPRCIALAEEAGWTLVPQSAP